MVDGNEKLIVGMVGVLCSLISMLFYISMQLIKKLTRRMERINQLIAIQSSTLAFMACATIFIANAMVNFVHDNSSEVVSEAMPWKLHERFYLLGFLLLFISLSSFLASWMEVKLMFTINNVVCTFTIIALIFLAVTTETSSIMVSSQMPEKCEFIIPQFS